MYDDNVQKHYLFIVISLILQYIFHQSKYFVSVRKSESTGERAKEKEIKRVKERGNGLFIEKLWIHEKEIESKREGKEGEREG